MEAFRGTDTTAPWRLTRLYSDAKRSYRHAVPTLTGNDIPEVSSLHRKSCIQKDRLIAWGFEWTDGHDVSSEGTIDESVERAGFTEVVESVLQNIVQIIQDLDRTHQRTAPATPLALTGGPDEKRWNASDLAHYEDLIRDLTNAIDLLCDLSRTRRTVQQEQSTRADATPSSASDEKRKIYEYNLASVSSRGPSQHPSFYDYSEPAKPSTESLKMDRSSLIMPEEAPPPYDNFGMPTAVRNFGRLRTSNSHTDFKGNFHPETTIPVMVEYTNYDPVYQNKGVPLPLNRLEHLAGILTNPDRRPDCLLRLIGYFEERSRPCLGLVYEIPETLRPRDPDECLPASSMRPISLLNLLQTTSRSQHSSSSAGHVAVPALEERFSLASNLASGFSYLLSHEFAHQDVNSSGVTFFPAPSSQISNPSSSALQYAIRKPVLCSFDLFTEYDIDTSPDNLNQNIYRHPEDPRIKGPESSGEHLARFEIYSLGLVLLEIGLWIPLADIFKEKYSLKDFSIRLEKIWVRRLASKCTTAYMHAVQECLTVGMDHTTSQESLRKSYDRVCAKLQKCCLLDDEDDSIVTDASRSMASQKPVMLSERKESMGESPSDHKLTSSPDQISQDQKIEASDNAAAIPEAPAESWPARKLEPEFEITSNAQLSVLRDGDAKPARYSFTDCKLSADVLAQWPALGRRLTKIVSKALRNPKESSSIGIESTGETEDTARPTLCVMCTSTKRVQKVIEKHFNFDRSTFDLIVMRGGICRSKLSTQGDGPRRSIRTSSADQPAENFSHHIRPICGASIGAYKDDEHLPPVSFGGIVLVDGEPYGMSVHHMLEQSDCDEDDDAHGKPPRSSAGRKDGSIQTVSELITQFSDDDETSDLDDMSDFDDDSSDVSEAGDTEGIDCGEGDEVPITQPALADVADNFFPCDEDKDEEHLESHSLGHIHASSGIKRMTYEGVEHEVDWALFKLKEDRLQPHNLIAGGKRFCQATRSIRAPQLREPVCRTPYTPEEDWYPSRIAKYEELGGLSVHCLGRTSGLGSGRISKATKFVKMYGRSSWSESWTVEGNVGVPGDSGAWIVDNHHGRVCGQVLAWSKQWDMAYISPMDITLHHMKQILGAKRICLPGEEAESVVAPCPSPIEAAQ
ncbi:MAG: hypothetical protein M1831_000102 [Alyxoria varia]|nr:MAG: hypothetical protein M1831_000102 [Alyxoria varia]